MKLCTTFMAAFLAMAAARMPAGDRVALIIGCNKYINLSEGKQLSSPVADATDVAAALKALGYTLVTGAAVTDAGKEAIITATETFATQAKDADAAVFYFSGHGIQVGEDNCLLPSDAPLLSGISVLKNRAVHPAGCRHDRASAGRWPSIDWCRPGGLCNTWQQTD